MVSFEEMIKSLELRDVLIKFLISAHKAIKDILGFDLDRLQIWVFNNTPPFTASNAFLALTLSIIFWFVTFYIVHYAIVSPLMKSLQRNSCTEYYFAMSPKQKLYYSSYYHGILHGVISFCGATYCFLYADGEPETTWFRCDWFKLNMFDLQKFLNMFSAGYLIFQLLLINYV